MTASATIDRALTHADRILAEASSDGREGAELRALGAAVEALGGPAADLAATLPVGPACVLATALRRALGALARSPSSEVEAFVAAHAQLDEALREVLGMLRSGPPPRKSRPREQRTGG